MAVVQVTSDGLYFECVGKRGTCRSVNRIAFAAISVYAGREGIPVLKLPPCPKCGAQSECWVGTASDDARNHVRRIAWKRAVAAGNYLTPESRDFAVKHSEDIAAFYAAEGREGLRAQYDDDTSAVMLR